MWTATTQPVLVPDLSDSSVQAVPQALALLSYYPTPNLTGDPRYNYQAATTVSTHQDALQSRMDKSFGNKNQLYGGFAFQSTRTGGQICSALWTGQTCWESTPISTGRIAMHCDCRRLSAITSAGCEPR